MKDIFEKISSYNLFNYLLPGILFVTITKLYTGYQLILENNFIGSFFYYFIGMVISRFGSLVIEPILKRIKFVKFAEYSEFITASKVDEKIEIFSEQNNTYRTITSMIFLILAIKGYSYFDKKFHFNSEITLIIVVVLIFFMFLFAYRKQTTYITKRISKANNS